MIFYEFWDKNPENINIIFMFLFPKDSLFDIRYILYGKILMSIYKYAYIDHLAII